MQFYSLPDFKKLGRAMFGSRVGMLHFSADGSHIFVLTHDQNAYVFDSKLLATTSPVAPAPAATASLATPASAPH